MKGRKEKKRTGKKTREGKGREGKGDEETGGERNLSMWKEVHSQPLSPVATDSS